MVPESAWAALAADDMAVISCRPPVPDVPMAPETLNACVAMVSPSLAPTWNVKVVPEPNTAVPLNFVWVMMLLISWAICVTSARDRVLVVGAVGAVVVLHLQVTDALQHRVHLGQRAFRGLDERDAVLRVALRLSQAADLTAHLLARWRGRRRRRRHG